MRTRRNAEHIRYLLQQVRADQDQGLTLGDSARKLGVCEMTIRRWRARFEGPVSEEAGRVRDLEVEVDRLKRLVAELLLEKKMLEDIAKKKW
jgi:putative transposase